jgi:nitroreductase
MLSDNNLYQAILERRSARRYAQEQLSPPVLAQVENLVNHQIRPLVPENRFQVLVRDVPPGEDLVELLGGYGRLVAPPHYLVPSLQGERAPLVDLGYRVEQIAVRLTAMGLGSCYVASLHRQDMVRARFDLPSTAIIGAFLVFGQPATSLTGRAVNYLIRATARATNKLSVERIFFQDTFDTPATPPEAIAPLIEAARHAPSAANAQPWRFLWRDGRLFLFLQTDNRRYGYAPVEEGGLRLYWYDGGICMANVALALEALGIEGTWQLVDEKNDLPLLQGHPANLQPLAVLI